MKERTWLFPTRVDMDTEKSTSPEQTDGILHHPAGLSITPRSKHKPANSVEGKTTSECPVCHCTRSRAYVMEGPYTLSQIQTMIEEHKNRRSPEFLLEIIPRVSASKFFERPILFWFVSPCSDNRSDKYYLVDVSAKCGNEYCARYSDKPTAVPEHSGYRRFGLSGIIWNRFKASIHWEVTIRKPDSGSVSPV
jgi:hypothetical protein